MRFFWRATFVLTALCASQFAQAQAPNCTPGRDLLTMPEIKSRGGRLTGVLMLSDELRSLPQAAGGAPCDSVRLRFFKGFNPADPTPWPSTGDILPGPTLRARVGDLVTLTFLNQINPSNFPNTLDQAEQGKTDGCDSAFAQRQTNPGTRQIYPRNDKMPNCLHGSSTANVHFHGTHTTPSTTGDNVLLYVRPALRVDGELQPKDDFTSAVFKDIFKQCEAAGSPQRWTDLPAAWQTKQEELLQLYDSTAPYKGVPGALPASMKLWPANKLRLDAKKWPQYSIGAYPYCFRLPEYDPAKVKMGQAPGTHWYHAHKHGSTALNVGNGMTGAFIIEGAYDDALRNFYKETAAHKNWGLTEQVLVIQQLDSALNLMSPTNQLRPAPLSINGRLNPVITMKPNQVQLWRIVNGAHRSFVQFDSFAVHGPGGQTVQWRQIAQDGVQFAFRNYERIGSLNARFNMATANRVDLLVKAPAFESDYALQVVTSVSDVPAGTPVTLLTVRVKDDGKPVDPPMDFITQSADFPKLPAFLGDINGPFTMRRDLAFNTDPKSKRGGNRMPLHTINNALFDGHHVDQPIFLDATEEWTISNRTVDIAHPFHIHVNPFQIVEVFQPNTGSARDPNSTCFADPTKPATWKPCTPLTPPYVWWDSFAIPTARADALPNSVCTQVDQCPADIQPFTACSGGTCTTTIPGYFKMRSRFVDFTGQYVLHCHILAHEDRGMMQLVEVFPKPEAGIAH